MSSARRTLLTATAAGTLLGALWFVPSAHATDAPVGATGARSAAHVRTQGRAVSADAPATADGRRSAAAAPDGTSAALHAPDGVGLADTGSVDTTPYVVGGTAFLALGAGFVVYSIRRERLGF
ncbi:hypothetical protein [Streptomyces sp. NPDC046985]|uniref:hypothetical protein n=1 Tax=Streptomyces sp. NPDC046985 TaxID=3155377 RepID=UPI0033C01DBC